VLEISDLTVSYGAVRALDQVSLSVEEGTVTAVLGANGAGKTSLLRAVNGLVRSRAGHVRLGAEELTGRAPEEVVRLGVAHVPEGRGVITELTVEENLRLGGLWRRDPATLREDLATVYGMFPALAERRARETVTLSGGERQMLAIGRALMSRPRLLLLDEPSLGLAPKVITQIMTVVRGLRDTQGLTVLLVEQNARSALSIADAAVVLNVGRVVASGDAARLGSDETLRHAYLGF
jgi:branched-chain amino acid transport system ATP-binding protein